MAGNLESAIQQLIKRFVHLGAPTLCSRAVAVLVADDPAQCVHQPATLQIFGER